jgi:hypothetical protein
MIYRELSKEDFDAIVTGELTHVAIWLEGEVHGIICDYFVSEKAKWDDFLRLVLRRDGLTFQDKIEIVRGMLPLFPDSAQTTLKRLLLRVEEFKAIRNAFVHGLDVSADEHDPLKMRVEIIGRNGKEKVIEISPETHQELLDDAQSLLAELNRARSSVHGA